MAAKQPSVETSVAFLGTSKRNPYRSGAGSQAPDLYNSQVDPVTYNGFQWSFSAGISWGRFISGEPFIIVPAAGINVTGVSYETSSGIFENCPTIKTGYSGQEQQAIGAGITMWVNGSMKNPKPFWESQDLKFTMKDLGSTIYPWNYDERTSQGVVDRKSIIAIRGTLVKFAASMSDFLQFPVGLCSGDNLVTAKSSWNGDHSRADTLDGEAGALWVGPEMSRMCIEKYGILTALSQGPTYADCYRPPVFWNGASLANRPIFYRQNMVKNTEDYVIDTTDLKNIKGVTLDFQSEKIQSEINAWNDFVNNMWISSIMPYYSGYAGQLAVGAYDTYNTDTSTSMSGYGGGYAKVKDQMLQSVYAPWVTPANRRKALDKVTQFAIDCWGIPNAGGIGIAGAGHASAVMHPWIVWLGWLYNRPDMTKYYLGKQILDRIAPGLTGNFAISKRNVPLEFFYKHMLTSDYRQRVKIYGSNVTPETGFTGWVATNPDIPLYWGLTMTSKAAQGACGFGWLYKVTGISAAYGYTSRSIRLSGQYISGSFATIVCHRDTVFRLAALGPGSGLTGTAQLPLSISSTGKLLKRGFDSNLDCGSYWSFDDGAMRGLNLEIVSGPGAGNTAYRILEGYNHFIKRKNVAEDVYNEEEEEFTLPRIFNLRYPTFILDRDFDNGPPTDQSTIKIYPIGKNSTEYGFDIQGWMYTLGTKGFTQYGPEQQSTYSEPSYNHISDEPIVKHYSLHNWLGITEDQFLIDYVKGVYFDENVYDIAKRQKWYGSPYVGSIFANENDLGGAIVAKFLGISGNQYAATFIDDLGGQYDNDPSVPLDGITLEFLPDYIQTYQVVGGSGKTYSGYGKVFSEPQTILKIKAIIDDKLFTDTSQVNLYNLLRELKVQSGPFLSNVLANSDDINDDIYKDRITFIDYGKYRNLTSPTETIYVRRPLNLQNIYQINQSIIAAQQSNPTIDPTTLSISEDPILVNIDVTSESTGAPKQYQLKTAKYNFVTSRYTMAGAVGIVPYPWNSCKLASSYRFKSLFRHVGPDKYKFVIGLSDTTENNSNINLDNIYYCLASPRIGGTAFSWDMPEEYIYENWKKIENPQIIGSNLIFTDTSIPLGSPAGLCFGTGTTDKLIFFKYMVDRDFASINDKEFLIQYAAGKSGPILNSTTLLGGSNNELISKYKYDSIKIKNSNGNNGILTFAYTGNITNNDYRNIKYNHFRIYHNNYFDFETYGGVRLLETFVDDPQFGMIPTEFNSSTDFYIEKQSLNGKNYYIPKNSVYEKTIINGEPPNSNIGFFDSYIGGQTYNLFLPPHPQTLLYVTGAT